MKVRPRASRPGRSRRADPDIQPCRTLELPLRQLCRQLRIDAALPGLVVDYNQNARDRTIASPYSVRAKAGAPVSAPLEWDELPGVTPEDFTVGSMPARFADVGDRFAAIDDVAHSLEPLLELYERDESEGESDMPYPPDYPKMPGEPKRVQPSRDRDRKRE